MYVAGTRQGRASEADADAYVRPSAWRIEGGALAVLFGSCFSGSAIGEFAFAFPIALCRAAAGVVDAGPTDLVGGNRASAGFNRCSEAWLIEADGLRDEEAVDPDASIDDSDSDDFNGDGDDDDDEAADSPVGAG